MKIYKFSFKRLKKSKCKIGKKALQEFHLKGFLLKYQTESYIPIISLKATELRVEISNSIPLLRFTFIPPL